MSSSLVSVLFIIITIFSQKDVFASSDYMLDNANISPYYVISHDVDLRGETLVMPKGTTI